MTIGTNSPLRITRKTIGGVTYPFIDFAVSHEDSVEGFVLEVDVGNVVAAATTVEVYNLSGDESLSTEKAGDTHYDVNSGAAATKYLGDLTFDFTVYTRNKVALKQGGAIGAMTIPNTMQPIMGFLFLDADLRITEARVTRRTNRMGG
jgi:hypothetical protein